MTFGQGQGERLKKVTLPYFSETIQATVTKFSTKVLWDNALLNIYNTMTLTEGQGHKGRLSLFSEKNITFGTTLSCDMTL